MALLFIYNANSGKINALLDAGHKLLNPSTYKCNLCALTFDTFTENKVWQNFREENNIDMKFYHKDEFEDRFPTINMIYPVILKLENNQLTVEIPSDILNKIPTVEVLIKLLKINL